MNFLNFLTVLFFIIFHIPDHSNLSVVEVDECKVRLASISGIYEGDCKKGVANGQGKAKGIDSYEGQFKEGQPHGIGTYTWANGDIYSGPWKKGKKEGEGKLTKLDGRVVNGYWKKDEYVGVDKEPFLVIQKGADILRVGFRKVDDVSQKIELIFE